MPNSIEPAKPSQDFFGLIFGAIGCLPNSTPPISPPVSLMITTSRNVTSRATPCSSASISAAKEPSIGTYAMIIRLAAASLT